MATKEQARRNARARASAPQREAADTAAYLAERAASGSNAAAGPIASPSAAPPPPPPVPPVAPVAPVPPATPPRKSAYANKIEEDTLKRQAPENMFRIGQLYNKLHPGEKGLSADQFDLATGVLKPYSPFYKQYVERYQFRGVVTEDIQNFTKAKNEIDRYYNEHPKRKATDPPFISRMSADAYGGPPGNPKARAAPPVAAQPVVAEGVAGKGKKGKRSASSDSEGSPSAKRPRARFLKGSQEAKDEMARIRALKKK